MFMTKSQEFIKKYAKALETGGDFYNLDACLQKPKLAEGRRKFLLILPTPAITKSVSATVSALVDMFAEEMPGWYIDVAYLPTAKDLQVYDKCNMPYCIGQQLHLDASHYDMVGFSISVLHEVLTTPVIIKSFSRCDKPIPLTWTERKDLKVGECPILMCGGITAAHGDIMFGELGDGRQSYLDFMCLGVCDTTKWVCEELDKKWTGSTNQDFFNHCMGKFDFFYHPQAYHVVYKDNLIVENTKINPHAQDWVKPYYPEIGPDSRLGEGRTFTQANGANAGDSQVRWSESCTGFGVCAFCAEGSYCGRWKEETIETIKRNCLKSKRWSAGVSCKPLSYNCNHMSDFTECIAVMNTMFPKVTYLNMRLEELARDTESFRMMKFTGASRLSAPIEGISRRIRQGFLNKNLSDEAIDTLFDFMIGQGISDLKVGCIYTGFEEDQDWEEVRKLISSAKAKAASLNKKCPARLKFCATKEAITPIPGVGLIRQDELSVGKVQGFEVSNIIAVEPQSPKEVVKVTTQFGTELKVTPHHKVVTRCYPSTLPKEEFYTEAQFLKKGQWIYQKIGTEVYGSYQVFKTEPSRYENEARELKLDESLAKVFGWYMGDGCVESETFRTWGCYFNNEELSIKLEIEEILRSLGYTPHEHRAKESIKGFRVHNKSFVAALVREFGNTAHNKRISGLILKSPKSVQVEFLRYWFAADGTVVQGKKSSRVKLFSANKQVLLDAQVMLFNMGIVSTVRSHKVRYQQGTSLVSVLEIKNFSVAKFASTVGIAGVKGTRITKVKEHGSHCLRSHGILRVRVASVERLAEPEKVYALEVENKSYLTNGILSHNTALVYYPGTGLELQERRTSRISFLGQRYFTDEIYEKNKAAGVSIKINGFRGSTFIEQAIVDLGGSLTHWVQDHLVAQMNVAYNMRPIATDENFPSFKALITNPDKYFAERDPDCYISPFHRIRLELEGTIASYWRRLQDNRLGNEPSGKCLYTYQDAKTTCAFGKIKQNPIRKYADVLIKEGVMTGTNEYLLEGCTACTTPKERLSHQLKRTWNHKYSVSDLQAQVVTRTQYKYRFVIKRLKEFSVLSPHNTAFTAMAALLRQSEEVLQNYWNLTDHSLYNQMDPELVSDIYGIQVLDVVFKDRVTEAIKEALPKANEELDTVQFLGVQEIPMDEKLTIKDYNIYRFKAKGIPAEAFFTGSRSYNGAVRVLGKVDMQPKVTQTVDKTLVYPNFKVTTDGVVGTFALPRRYNPYLFFQEVLAEKKLTQKAIQQAVEFEIVAVVQPNSYTTCKCGRPMVQSVITGKPLHKCANCVAKALLK